LAEAGVDEILASLHPAISEASGLTLAATAKPYLLRFVVRSEETFLDGPPLYMAIAAIDATVTPQPFVYMINCTHASFVRAALPNPTNSSTLV